MITSLILCNGSCVLGIDQTHCHIKTSLVATSTRDFMYGCRHIQMFASQGLAVSVSKTSIVLRILVSMLLFSHKIGA